MVEFLPSYTESEAATPVLDQMNHPEAINHAVPDSTFASNTGRVLLQDLVDGTRTDFADDEAAGPTGCMRLAVGLRAGKPESQPAGDGRWAVPHET